MSGPGGGAGGDDPPGEATMRNAPGPAHVPVPAERPFPDMPAGPLPEPLERFALVIELPVLWADQDAMGHVNNTVPVRWFESARLAYLEQEGIDGLLAGAGLGPILAAVSCNFRRQLHYPDRVLVGITVARVGRTSLTMEHVVWSRRLAAISADGDSTVVAIDYCDGRPRPIPDPIRDAIARLERRIIP